MPQHVHTEAKPLSFPHVAVGMLAIELPIDQMQVRVRFRRDGSAVDTRPATEAELPEADGLRLRVAECSIDRRLAQKQLRKPPREHFLARAVGTVKYVGVRHAIASDRLLDEALGVGLVLDVSQ
jgi:hypothetical protein